MATSDRNEPGLVGYIGLAVIVVIVGTFGYVVYRWVSPTPPKPAVISLSAYFVDQGGNPLASDAVSDSHHLKIKGAVHQDGKPLKDGTVRLTASRQDYSFQQAIALDLKNGEFGTEDPAFRALRPEDHIHITAEVWSPQLSEAATRELFLNTTSPALTRTGQFIVWTVILLLICTFFFSFTGKSTRTKNRVAVIFSYVIIAIFLALPLLAPVLLLRAFPRLQSGMIGVPVGLVVTRTGKEPAEAQWAINIGGYSTRVKPPAKGASPSAQSKDNVAPRTETSPGGSSETPKPAEKPGDKIVTTLPSQNRGDAAAPVPASDSEGVGLGDVVKVEGGLVIPLYVIILSVIGGAINMTRKVPRLQREGEMAEVSVPAPVTRLATRVESTVSAISASASRMTGSSGLSSRGDVQSSTVETPPRQEPQATVVPESAALTRQQPPQSEADPHPSNADARGSAGTQATQPARAGEVDAELDELVKTQIQRNSETKETLRKINGLVETLRGIFDARKKDAPPMLGFESFEDWWLNRLNLRELLGSPWRVELLSQYMYLISAPFLAIVAYYMLDLVGLNKLPILVLISFSVGLISERILSWLLGMASGYLRSDTATQSHVA